MAYHSVPRTIEVHLTPATIDGMNLQGFEPVVVMLEVGCDVWKQKAMEALWEKVHETMLDHDVLRLTYQDEENDWCTLTEVTLGDAQHFASVTSTESGVERLHVRIVLAQHSLEASLFASIPVNENGGQASIDGQDSEKAPQDFCQESIPELDTIGKMVEAVMKELDSLANGISLPILVPLLASSALRLVEEAQDPALFVAVEPLLGLKEGKTAAADLPEILKHVLPIHTQLLPDRVKWLTDRLREEVLIAVKKLEAASDNEQLEVHMKTTCDGCQEIPIIGNRFKSLHKDNFNLCQTCFDSWQQDTEDWVRVVADPVPLRGLPSFDSGGASASSHAASNKLGDVEREHDHTKCDCDDAAEVIDHTTLVDHSKKSGAELPACKKLPLGGSSRVVENKTEAVVRKVFENTVGAAVGTVEQAVGTVGQAVGAAVGTIQAGKAKLIQDLQHDGNESSDMHDLHEEACKAQARAHFKGSKPRKVGEDIGRTQRELKTKTEENAALRDALRCVEDALRSDVSDAEERAAEALNRARDAWAAQAALQKEVDALKAVNAALQAELSSKEAELQKSMASAEYASCATRGKSASASVHSCTPFVLKVHEDTSAEAPSQDVSAQGDVTETWADLLAQFDSRQAFCIGHVNVYTGNEGVAVSASTRVTLVNNGEIQWPETAVVAAAQGDSFGCPVVPLGPLNPGEGAEVVMDLLIPQRAVADTVRSAWCIRDATTGSALGPLLLLETSWIAE